MIIHDRTRLIDEVTLQLTAWYDLGIFEERRDRVKKFLIAVVTLVLGVSLSAAAHAEGYGKVTVLGDSIASGFGLPGYFFGNNYSASGSFGNLIAKESTGYENLAKDGSTTANLLSRLDDADLQSAVKSADNIIISIGGNDFLMPMLNAFLDLTIYNDDLLSGLISGSFSIDSIFAQASEAVLDAAQSVDILKTGEHLDEIMGKIRTANPYCEIYILTVYDPFEGAAGMEMLEDAAKQRLPELNAEITAAAHRGRANVIDVNSAFAGHATEYTNIRLMDVHPSSAGHKVIYDLISSASEELSDEHTVGNPNTGAPSVTFIGATALAAALTMTIFRQKSHQK